MHRVGILLMHFSTKCAPRRGLAGAIRIQCVAVRESGLAHLHVLDLVEQCQIFIEALLGQAGARDAKRVLRLQAAEAQLIQLLVSVDPARAQRIQVLTAKAQRAPNRK